MIGSGEDLAKNCDFGSDARRRLEVRDLDKAAKVASSSDDVSPCSDEVELGPRRFCLPSFGLARCLAGSRQPLSSRFPLGLDDGLRLRTGDALVLEANFVGLWIGDFCGVFEKADLVALGS